MSDRRFEYEEEILVSCARSELAAFVAKHDRSGEDLNIPTGKASVVGNDASCSILHEQHAKHYSRPPPTPFIKQSMTEEEEDDGHRYVNIDGRLRRFLRSVLHVHSHNSQTENLHRMGLNQFADEEATALLLSQQTVVEMEGGSAWDTLLDYDSVDSEWILDPLALEHMANNNVLVDIAANLSIGHGGTQHLNHKTKTKTRKRIQDAIKDNIKFPDRRSDPNFAVPCIDDPDLDGELLKVKPRRKVEKELEHGVLDRDDEFGEHLNWATKENPDGVPIVKDAFDQVSCFIWIGHPCAAN